MKKTIEELVMEKIGIVSVGYELTDKQCEEIENIKSKDKKTTEDLKILDRIEDDCLNTEKSENITTKIFSWKKPNEYKNYKFLTIKETAFDGITKNDIFVFRFDTTVIENLKKRKIVYSENLSYDNAIFENDLDICKVTKIDNEKITLQSIKNGVKSFVYADNFKRCVDDMNVAFKVLRQITA